MGPELVVISSIVVVIVTLVIAINLIIRGYKIDDNGNRDLNKIKAGWIIIGILSVLLSALLGFLIYVFWYSLALFVLFGVFPLLIIGGFIALLVIGIKNIEKKKRISGWIMTISGVLIGLGSIALLLMFFTGLIPINLM